MTNNIFQSFEKVCLQVLVTSTKKIPKNYWIERGAWKLIGFRYFTISVELFSYNHKNKGLHGKRPTDTNRHTMSKQFNREIAKFYTFKVEFILHPGIRK